MTAERLGFIIGLIVFGLLAFNHIQSKPEPTHIDDAYIERTHNARVEKVRANCERLKTIDCSQIGR